MSAFPIFIEAVLKPLTLYRGCHGDAISDLVAAMRSNYEVDRPPHPAERRAIPLYMSVSMFEDAEPVRRAAQLRPARVGTHLARVELRSGLGVGRADTGSPGHWSVWGLPRQLADCVVEVVPIA